VQVLLGLVGVGPHFVHNLEETGEVIIDWQVHRNIEWLVHLLLFCIVGFETYIENITKIVTLGTLYLKLSHLNNFKRGYKKMFAYKLSKLINTAEKLSFGKLYIPLIFVIEHIDNIFQITVPF